MRKTCIGFLLMLFIALANADAQIVWSGKTKVFIGDSNTEGIYHTSTSSGYASHGSNRFSSLLSSMKGSIENNKGVSGMVVQDALSGCTTTKASESLIPIKDDDHLFLYIMLGSNDIAYNNGSFTPAGFQNRYDQLVANALSKGWPSTNIILISPPWKPVGSSTEPGNSAVTSAYDVFYDYCDVTSRVDEARQQAYVDAVQAVATARNAVFIDLYTEMKNHPDRASFLSEANGGYDRMHLSVAGHQFVANTLANFDYPQVLPLSLINFLVIQKNNTSQLNWTSENEVNTKEFIIERSEDGISFKSIGNVKASGNSSGPKNYQFLDPAPSTGNIHYRLKMVDLDNQFEYSKTVVIRIGKEMSYRITPNPARNYVEIRKEEQEPTNVQIADISGKIVHQESFSGRLLKISTSNFKKGVYILSLKREGAYHTQKLIVQ